MTFQRKLSAAVASTALVFTGFAPAMAAPIETGVSTPLPLESDAFGWNSENDKVERHRGWRGYRGYGRYGRYRHRRHRVDAGDVIAGVAILGGIIAIASAASNSKKRDRRYEDRDYRSDRRYEDRRSDRYDDRRSSGRDTSGMDSAINACADAAERQAGGNARVSEIRSVTRDGNGWRVEGEMTSSSERTFQCGSTNGRVDFVQLGAEDLAYAN